MAQDGNTGYLTGLTGELLVASEMARLGFQVCLPSGNSPDLDLLAYRAGQMLAVQVKTAAVGNAIQLRLKKFLTLTTDAETQLQTLSAKQPPLDEKLLVAFVFLGQQAGRDRIYVGQALNVAAFLEHQHLEYLRKHSGMRPGKNKKSDHIAIAEEYVVGNAAFSELAQCSALSSQRPVAARPVITPMAPN